MQLRVLTLNAWALPEPLSTDLTGRMRRIGEALPRLGADVVALQEIWTHGVRRQLAAAGRRAGYPHIWHNRAAFGGSGLMLLSRLPLSRAQFRRFALGGLPQRIQHGDYYGGKGFAQVELATPEGALCLLITHLQARYGERSAPDEYLGQRAAQAVEIAAAVSRRPEPTLALGDFNFQEGHPEYRVLLGLTGLRDVAAELDHRQDTSQPSHASPDPKGPAAERIDLVLARDGAAVAVAPASIRRVLDEGFGDPERPRLYSDHCGLLADIEIGGVPTRPHPPDTEALQLAEELLARGVELASERRRQHRQLSGLGAGTALALMGTRGYLVPPRRHLLRTALVVGAGAVIASSATAAALAEIFAPPELAAFERVRAVLAELQAIS
jgi:sphingomyelin phosphodiesterase 2